MFCMNCGREIEEGARYCDNCGKPIFMSQPYEMDVLDGRDNNSSSKNQPQMTNQPNRTDGMCIAGFVVSFISPIIGWILCENGIKRAEKNGVKGASLAKAGKTICIIVFMLSVAIYLSSAIWRRNHSSFNKTDENVDFRASFESVAEDIEPVTTTRSRIVGDTLMTETAYTSSFDSITVMDLIGSVDGDVYVSEAGNITCTLDENSIFNGRDGLQASYGEISVSADLASVPYQLIAGQNIVWNTGESLIIAYIYDPTYSRSSHSEYLNSFLESAQSSAVQSIETAGYTVVRSENKIVTMDNTDYPAIQIDYQSADSSVPMLYTMIFDLKDNNIITALYIYSFDDESLNAILSNVHFLY